MLSILSPLSYSLSGLNYLNFKYNLYSKVSKTDTPISHRRVLPFHTIAFTALIIRSLYLFPRIAIINMNPDVVQSKTDAHLIFP